MADKVAVYSASTLVFTGRGFVTGLVASTSVGSPLLTLYDNTAGSGTKIFEAYIDQDNILVIFFPEAFAPRFATGLYATVGAGCTVTLWSRQL